MKSKTRITAGTRVIILVGLLLVMCSPQLSAKDPSDKLDARVADLEAQMQELYGLTAHQQAEISALQTQLAAAQLEIAVLQADLSGAESLIDALQADLAAVVARPIFDLEPYVYVDYNDLENLVGPHVIFEGVNVHVRNATGQTGTRNRLGNLIVGYNEWAEGFPRSGSHNLVVGPRNGYSSVGGLVAGELNIVSGPWASVSGGQWNTASAICSSVSGGADNTASGYSASVSGGFTGMATGFSASVSGGTGGRATSHGASVSGGNWRSASGTNDWVAGSLWEDD